MVPAKATQDIGRAFIALIVPHISGGSLGIKQAL